MNTLTLNNNRQSTIEKMLIQACSEADAHRDEALHWQKKYEQLSKISQRYRYNIEAWQQLAQIVLDDAADCQR